MNYFVAYLELLIGHNNLRILVRISIVFIVSIIIIIIIIVITPGYYITSSISEHLIPLNSEVTNQIIDYKREHLIIMSRVV